MLNLSFLIGLVLAMIIAAIFMALFKKTTLQLSEQTESFLLKFGKLEKSFSTPGLYWIPERIFPWVQLITVSKQIDYRNFKGIQVSDCFGTTVIVDLWLEFRVADAYKALFSVENWEEVLQSVVIHSTSSILCSQTVGEILQHRTQLSDQLKNSISIETNRWGITLLGAMIQNVGLLPEVSKQFFHSVAAKIDRTTALVQEEGRINVAKLDAETSYQIAELNGQARVQLPLKIGHFYQTLAADPQILLKFQEYWELTNLDPRKTVAFSGFHQDNLGEALEAVKCFEATKSH